MYALVNPWTQAKVAVRYLSTILVVLTCEDIKIYILFCGNNTTLLQTIVSHTLYCSLRVEMHVSLSLHYNIDSTLADVRSLLGDKVIDGLPCFQLFLHLWGAKSKDERGHLRKTYRSTFQCFLQRGGSPKKSPTPSKKSCVKPCTCSTYA